jgi:electron transfer flavoprotein beta subunit
MRVKIFVCVKRVPDTATRIQIGADARSIDPSGVKYVMNPYDEFAVEAALRTREAAGEGEVVVVSVGGEESTETLRTALALGADRAVLLRGETGQDGLATAKILASELEPSSPDLILLGVKAVDDDGQQVGPMLATILGRECATSVSEFRVAEGAVTCEREVEGGKQTVRVPMGSVLTIGKGAYEPRYPTLPGIMAAKKKPVEERDAPAQTSRVEILSLEPPPARHGVRMVGEGTDAVPELVRLLREEAGVI